MKFNIPAYCIAAALYVLFSIQYISYYPLWDGFYFFWILKDALIKINSIETFFEFLNLNGHPSMLYAGYLSIGQLFFWDNQYVLHIQNIFLNILSGYCFYKLVIFFVGRKSYFESILIASIYLFNPLINASLFNLNLDFPVLIFFTIFIYCFVYDKKYFAIISATFLIFSKENGIILYLLFLSALYPTSLICALKGKIPRKSMKESLLYLLPLLLLGLYVLVKMLFKQSPFFSADHGSSLNIIKEFFSWKFPVIWTRLLEIFVLNFNWIPSIFITIGAFKAIAQLKCVDLKINRNKIYFIGIIAIFIGYLITSLFLFKYLVHPRYMVANIFFILLLFATSLYYVIKIRVIRILILCLYVILIFFQNSKSLDPLSNKAFGYYYFGTHKIINIDKMINENYGYGPRDAMAYNLQYTVIDKLIRASYREIAKANSYFIITEDLDHPTISPKIRNENIQANIVVISQLNDIFGSLNGDELGFYLHIPQKHDKLTGLKILGDYFEILSKKEVALDGYVIELYTLKKITH